MLRQRCIVVFWTETEFIVVNWDSKILPDLCGTVTVDSHHIVVISHGFEQLLAASKLPSSKGEKVALAVYKTSQERSSENMTQANVTLVFDTRASNSGRLNGAYMLPEERLNRDSFFWIADIVSMKSCLQLPLNNRNFRADGYRYRYFETNKKTENHW